MTDLEKFLNFLEDQIGRPYSLGSTGPNDFDCSGLILAGLKNINADGIPRSSTDQATIGTPVAINKMKRGDLVFFDTGWVERKPNHNGICTSNGEMINANSYYNSVVAEKYDQGYWSDKIYGKARRIFDSNGKFTLNSTTTTNTSSNTPDNPSDTENFSDVPNSNPFSTYIMELRDQEVINGYPDGTFKPNANINRVESLKIILETLSITVPTSFDDLPFSDTKNDAWYSKYIASGVKNNIVNGHPNGTFKPDDKINRAEMCKIIFEAGNTDPALPSSSKFKDVALDAWFAKYVLQSDNWNMFDPKSSTKFAPGQKVTRGEMCKAIVNYLNNK